MLTQLTRDGIVNYEQYLRPAVGPLERLDLRLGPEYSRTTGTQVLVLVGGGSYYLSTYPLIRLRLIGLRKSTLSTESP